MAAACALAGLAPGSSGAAATPEPRVLDTPNDWGTSLTITWTALPADGVSGYEIWRMAVAAGAHPEPLPSAGWEKVKSLGATDTSFVDSGLNRHQLYTYTLVAVTPTSQAASAPTAPLAPRRQGIHHDRINILISVIAFVLTLLALVERARRGAKLFIRRIAGLEAVEEAVGRATEMGRPILYVPGLDPMDEVATVAAVDILGQVAKKAGQYETKLIVPTTDPIVMTVAQQVVRESFSAVGKPHLYRDEQVFYVTNSQFGFAAAVAGIMMREKPATNFLIGHFYAESLVLAETGNATGAIQIAGTDADAQLPFFITSCDYTLIGEELSAGAVYLSRRPLLLGALKSQDYAKVLLIAAMLVGIILSAINPDLAMKFRAVFK
ncbi:MAG TPA: fibronectin type III domain-containing protein [bacterium]|nr:fibronectin type III domain-containing protein [bacterium]